MTPKIRIISTGGTIDSSIEYDPRKKSVFNGTNLPRVLKQARLTQNIALEPLMQKDSADITEHDRALILKRCTIAKEGGGYNNPRYRYDVGNCAFSRVSDEKQDCGARWLLRPLFSKKLGFFF